MLNAAPRNATYDTDRLVLSRSCILAALSLAFLTGDGRWTGLIFLPSLVLPAKRTCPVPGGVRLRRSPILLLRIDFSETETSDTSDVAGLGASIALCRRTDQCSMR